MKVADLSRHVEAEKELSDELRKYAGQWVAIRDHAVVANAASPEELLAKIEGQRIDRRFRVSEEGPALL